MSWSRYSDHRILCTGPATELCQWALIRNAYQAGLRAVRWLMSTIQPAYQILWLLDAVASASSDIGSHTACWLSRHSRAAARAKRPQIARVGVVHISETFGGDVGLRPDTGQRLVVCLKGFHVLAV